MKIEMTKDWCLRMAELEANRRSEQVLSLSILSWT